MTDFNIDGLILLAELGVLKVTATDAFWIYLEGPGLGLHDLCIERRDLTTFGRQYLSYEGTRLRVPFWKLRQLRRALTIQASTKKLNELINQALTQEIPA